MVSIYKYCELNSKAFREGKRCLANADNLEENNMQYTELKSDIFIVCLNFLYFLDAFRNVGFYFKLVSFNYFMSFYCTVELIMLYNMDR